MLIVGRPKSEVEERIKVIRLNFENRYHLDELREQLYLEQEGICAICKKSMQDSCSVVCQIDHAISVVLYASFNCFSIEKACEHANARKNLVLVHSSPCNPAKGARDLEVLLERLESGEIVFGEAPVLTEERIQELRQRMRIGPLRGGRKAVESGQLASCRTPEHQREAGRIGGLKNKILAKGIFATNFDRTAGGRIGGLKNVASGHIQALGRDQGRKNIASGHLTSIASKGAHAAGTKNANSGAAKALGLRYGHINGRKNVENGNLERARQHCDFKEMGRISCHKRYHVNRGISKPDTCALCAAVLESKLHAA